MQSLTSRSTNRRRFMRLAGTGATALLAATAWPRRREPPPRRPTLPRRHRQRGLSQRIEHGGPERELRADHGELEHDHHVLQDGDRGGQRARQRRLRHGDGTPSKKSKTTIAARTITVNTASSSGSCTTWVAAPARRRRGGAGASRWRRRLPRRRWSAGRQCRRRDASELRRRRLLQLPQGPREPGHRLGQGDRRQRLDPHGVGHQHQPGAFTRGTTKSSSKTKKPDHAQDRDAQDHDVELDHGERHPDGGVDRPGRR